MTATATATTNYENLSTEDLANELYEFHRATWDYKLRFDWEDRAYIIAQLEELHSYHERMRSTFAGRESMRAAGWVVAETDPMFIQQAEWLAQERAREQAEWAAEIAAGPAVRAAESYEEWA